MGVRINLIGPPEIRVNDAPATIRGHKPWAVLARILLSDRPLGRQYLAAEVFPEAEDPLGALRWSLAELRRGVQDPGSFTGDPVVASLPSGTDVDAWELAEGLLDVDDAGSLLDGVNPSCSPGFESWLLIERERTASAIDGLLRRRIIEAQSLGDHGRAVTLAQQAVSRRPFDEGTHVLLVKALVGAGRQDTALQHVANTEQLFITELGVEPSSALREAARAKAADRAPGVSADAAARALLDAGRAAVDAGAAGAGMECLRRAVAEAEYADRHLQAMTLFELGTALVHAVRGFDDEGAVLLQQAVDLAIAAGDAVLAAQATRELAYTDALVGRRPTAAVYLDQGLSLAGDDTSALAGLQAVRAFNLAEWGRLEEGLRAYEEAIELARSVGNPRRQAWALGLGARAQLLGGEPDEARRWLVESLDLTEREGWISFRPWPVALLGEVRLTTGETGETVLADLEHSFALSCQLGDPCWEGASARAIALCHLATGEPEAAWRWIREARVRCTRESDTYAGMDASILATEAELAAQRGEEPAADAAARSLLTLAARTHQDGFARYALRLLGLSDPSVATP